ncbi:2-keto-4-pentenoate hydratase [Pimelobacter simplex]|uniref:2-keto-4-pentenoate hydratase n=1 Tax=Nocardioides simplex TaxID=2045 RepID=UPI0027DB96F8
MSETPAVQVDVVQQAADRLQTAARTGVPCRPVRDLIDRDDVAAAYAVQQRLTAARVAGGASIIGRKVGLTSVAVQEQLGVDQPDFGVLFDDMRYLGGDTVPYDAVLQPRVEAEIAFVLAHDLEDGDLDLPQVRAAVDYAVAALEICGSRVANWDISFADTVADNASSGAFVLGPLRRRLHEFEPGDVTMTMSVTGHEESAGSGRACLGDPLLAVQWLARRARDLGDPLRAGQIVLSGALGPMRPVDKGAQVVATLSGLGRVAVSFDEGNRS